MFSYHCHMVIVTISNSMNPMGSRLGKLDCRYRQRTTPETINMMKACQASLWNAIQGGEAFGSSQLNASAKAPKGVQSGQCFIKKMSPNRGSF